VLNSKLALHGIDDVEAFTAGIVQHSHFELSFHDRQELHAHLISECWRLSLVYRPGIIRGGFSLWAGTTLRKRLIDWERQRFGRTKWQFSDRTYERPRTEIVSLDDPQRSQLVNALGTRTGDLEASWDETLRGLYAGRDRARARDLKTLGLRPRRRAPY
jgi:hypothetical protein